MSSKILAFHTMGPRLSVENKSWRSVRGSSRLKPRNTKPSLMKIGRVSVASAFGVVLVIALSGAHLFAVNAYAAKGFELKQQHNQLAELEEQNKKLLIRQAEVASMMKLNDVALAYGLVPVANEEFVNGQQLSQR